MELTIDSRDEPTGIGELLRAFREALDGEDWQRIAGLNERTRRCVENAMQQDTRAVLACRAQLEELSALYQEMQAGCSRKRDAVADQLNQLNTGRSVARQYSSTSSL